MFFFFMKGFDSHCKLLANFERQCKKAKRPGFLLVDQDSNPTLPLISFHIFGKLLNLY